MSWIDKNGNFLTKSYIQVGNKMIFNPTEQQLLDAGYTKFVPQTEEQDPLVEAKEIKLNQLYSYDNSSNVNSFTLNNESMWLTVEERQQLATQIQANEGIGRTEMTKWFKGQSYTFQIPVWKQMLNQLEVYAGDALNVTEQHRTNINALTTVEEVENYNFTVGYPQKLAL